MGLLHAAASIVCLPAAWGAEWGAGCVAACCWLQWELSGCVLGFEMAVGGFQTGLGAKAVCLFLILLLLVVKCEFPV